MLCVWEEEGGFVLQTCLCWELEKPSTASFIAPARVKELTSYSFNLFEAAFISPEGGEWSSRMLGGIPSLIQDCPFSLTPQTLRRGCQIYSHVLQSPGLSGYWVSLCKVWPNNSVLRVHCWFWYYFGYWENIISAWRCKPCAPHDCRKCIDVWQARCSFLMEKF